MEDLAKTCIRLLKGLENTFGNPRTHVWGIPGSTGHYNESQNHAKHIDLLNTRGGFQDAWGIIMDIKIVQKISICWKQGGGISGSPGHHNESQNPPKDIEIRPCKIVRGSVKSCKQ